MKVYINGILRDTSQSSQGLGNGQDEAFRRQQTLTAFAQTIAQLHPEVLEVRVFGRGLQLQHGPIPVVDLLIILKQSYLPIEARPRSYALDGFRVTANYFPLTRQEIDEEIRRGNTGLERAVRESHPLYPPIR